MTLTLGVGIQIKLITIFHLVAFEICRQTKTMRKQKLKLFFWLLWVCSWVKSRDQEVDVNL